VNVDQLPAEQFAALRALPEVRHAFTTRVAGLDVAHHKEEALLRLEGIHHEIRESQGIGEAPFITAQQVHGNRIGVLDHPVTGDECVAGCDGLITNQPGICLGIYVADCCAAYLIDPVHKAIGLVHSGKKGTELGIVREAIDLMGKHFGSRAADLTVQLSPCIRPPHYEIDFAADIRQQCRDLGVVEIHDYGVCTACDLNRYYSYRAEKGRTGRMLAFLSLAPDLIADQLR